MKRIVCFICAIFIGAAYAETFTMTWLNEDKTTTYDTTTCTAGDDIILPTAPTKRGYTFIGWVGGYTPIEYIESTGTQYIDTGFKPNQDTRVVMEYQGSIPLQYGGRNTNKGPYYGIQYTSAQYMRVCYKVEGDTQFSDWSNYKTTIDQNKNEFLIKDSEQNVLLQLNFTYSQFQIDYNFTVFAYSSDGTVAGTLAIAKLYSLKLYDNGTLVRDMIPVLDPYDVPCMYDRVSEQFFYNAGTGNFIAGPVISE